VSTIGIVAVSLVIGLFLAVLIGSVIFLVWTCLKLHKAVILTQSEFSGQVQTHADDVRRFQTDTANLLKSHAEAFNQAVSRINGEGLELASRSILSAAGRIEKACIAFGELAKYILADRDTIGANGNRLQPGEYATPEPGEKFIGLSPTTQADLDAAAEDEPDSFPPGS